MAAFHFPVLFLRPTFEGVTLDAGEFQLAKRRSQVSTFDLATLATEHKLHLPYQLMDVLLGPCSVEVRVDAPSLQDAFDTFQDLRIGLYCQGISPFLSPFSSTHSINEYAGINQRSSGLLARELPEALHSGITSRSGAVEAWPFELSLQCIVVNSARDLTAEQFTAAADWAMAWRTLKKQSKLLPPLGDAATAAPTIGSLDQSLLHVWCGLEAIFPRVQTEVSFRVALYLAQLCSNGPARRTYFDRVRTAYQLRSDVAHGTKRGVELEEWMGTWTLLLDCLRAVVQRGGLSDEDALLADLLS